MFGRFLILTFSQKEDVSHLATSDEPESGSRELGPHISAGLDDKRELVGIESLNVPRPPRTGRLGTTLCSSRTRPKARLGLGTRFYVVHAQSGVKARFHATAGEPQRAVKAAPRKLGITKHAPRYSRAPLFGARFASDLVETGYHNRAAADNQLLSRPSGTHPLRRGY